MTTFCSTIVKGMPACLHLYKAIAASEIRLVLSRGCIPRAEYGYDQRQISLGENLNDALDLETELGESVSKDTHVVLEIRLSSLGVAYYTMLSPGGDYGFRSTLEKMSDALWHFHADLPC